ncbi:MAG: hypothetical protein ABGX04_02175 [Myxococcales bacterium]
MDLRAASDVDRVGVDVFRLLLAALGLTAYPDVPAAGLINLVLEIVG